MQDKCSESDYLIELMDPQRVVLVWHFLESDLKQSFLGDDSHSTNDIKIACEDASMQLWYASRNGEYVAFCITQMMQTPRQKTGVFLWCGGRDMKKWFKKGLAIIQCWLKSQGCDSISTIGRQGWGKLIGYDSVYLHYHKKL